eukprot:GHVL01035630.1.p1 GENE.GHVL01035630.1~~GHVL01035630.1.p1  ORF type:complete len:343 (+),score=103.24 GHVL01035630.1:1202-2230(+)
MKLHMKEIEEAVRCKVEEEQNTRMQRSLEEIEEAHKKDLRDTLDGANKQINEMHNLLKNNENETAELQLQIKLLQEDQKRIFDESRSQHFEYFSKEVAKRFQNYINSCETSSCGSTYSSETVGDIDIDNLSLYLFNISNLALNSKRVDERNKLTVSSDLLDEEIPIPQNNIEILLNKLTDDSLTNEIESALNELLLLKNDIKYKEKIARATLRLVEKYPSNNNIIRSSLLILTEIATKNQPLQNIISVGGGLTIAVKTVSSEINDMSSIATRLISVLCQKNEKNQNFICEIGGISSVIKSINRFTSDETVIHSCWALMHICSKNKYTQNEALHVYHLWLKGI